jgi:phage host-nuclease inhibitor protein Gam
MTEQPIPERLKVLEDEVAGLESMIDARTRRLWLEIEQLRVEIKEWCKEIANG